MIKARSLKNEFKAKGKSKKYMAQALAKREPARWREVWIFQTFKNNNGTKI